MLFDYGRCICEAKKSPAYRRAFLRSDEERDQKRMPKVTGMYVVRALAGVKTLK